MILSYLEIPLKNLAYFTEKLSYIVYICSVTHSKYHQKCFLNSESPFPIFCNTIGPNNFFTLIVINFYSIVYNFYSNCKQFCVFKIEKFEFKVKYTVAYGKNTQFWLLTSCNETL